MKNITSTGLILLLSLFFSSPLLANAGFEIYATPSAGNPEFNEQYHVGANDVLSIAVYGEEELTQEVRVTSGGFITYPLLGRIHVSGKSVVELEDFIREKLAKDYIRNPQVSVFVQEFSNIYVFGHVNAPGPTNFMGNMTALQAVSSAGGFSKLANKRSIRIVRTKNGEREVIDVDVRAIAKGEKEDVLLEPGDTVIVPESFF